jgi:hypothetical protein
VRSNFSLNDPKYNGKWNHIAVTFNGGNEVKFYINGVFDSTNYLQDSGINTFTPPLEIGSAEGYGQIKANLGTFRISSGVKTSFPYGTFAAIENEPTTAAGQIILQTPTGSPDLVILSLSTYPNPSGGVIVEAIVKNDGDLSTQNGFYTDLYRDHLPSGAGDYSGSLEFWINDPIAPSETVTLTTILTDLSILGPASLNSSQQESSFIQEISGILYAQTDSVGALDEPDEQNNIYSSGTSICLANNDSYEVDDSPESASYISVGELQSHNFSILDDNDWIKFDAVAGLIYQFQTLGLDVSADTYLYLYDTDGSTLLASNDDANGSLASSIHWNALSSGTYYLMVRHWNPNVGGCGTSYDIEILEQSEPDPPSVLEAISISQNQIDLSWSDNSYDEDGFEIERSPDGSSNWTLIATLGADISRYSDTGLSAGTTNFYRARSYNIVGYSVYSNIDGATTLSAPAAPSNLVATVVSQSQIDITWSDNSNNEDGFEIERSEDGINWTLFASVAANVVDISDQSLSPSTTYFYHVRSFNEVGYSDFSNDISAKTKNAPSELVTSGEILVNGTISGSYLDTHADDGVTEVITEVVKLGKPSLRHSFLEHKWTFMIPSNGEAIFYANAWMPQSSDGDNIVFSYSTNDVNYVNMFTISSISDEPEHEIFRLPPGITGIVYVRATDTDRTGGNLALDTLYVDHFFILVDAPPSNPPDMPSGLVATAVSSNQVDLEWTDNADNETGFEIERSLDAENWVLITTTSMDVTIYSDASLEASQRYNYRVRAINSAGNSDYTPEAIATTGVALTMHVGDLDGFSSIERNKWTATVSVLVQSNNHAPIEGATVTGMWNEDTSVGGSCITDTDGFCTITLNRISTKEASVIFMVTGIVHDSDIYVMADNHDEDYNSNGTTITVVAP